MKIHIVQPPKSSKLPKPKADATNAKRGKQQGESNAVKNIPIVPNLSMLFFSFIRVIVNYYSFKPLSLKALIITDTELKDIADYCAIANSEYRDVS